MKKILSLVGIVLISLTANAQDANQGLKGSWFATSQFGYQQTKTGDVKDTNLSIIPIVGTFVTPSVAIGAGLGYINMKSGENEKKIAKTDLIVIEPLARKYWNVAGSLYFFGPDIYEIQKWNYWDSNRYEHGFGYRMGVTIGYNIKINDKFLLDIFAGGGWHQGFYHGYYNDGTPGRYEKAENWNKSGEWLPYRGGVMLSYKLN